MVRMNFQIRWWRETEKLSSHPEHCEIGCVTPRKNPNRDFDSGFLKSYPADAVQADHPFPFSHGWMTVATASDFQ
jgi:hypothetical protein